MPTCYKLTDQMLRPDWSPAGPKPRGEIMGVTVEDMLKWGPCDRYSRKVLTSLMGSRKRLSAVQLLELDIPAEDRLWAVFHDPLLTDREMHLLACDFAESVLGLTGNDPRCAAAIATKRAFVDGEATEQDLAAARDAAWAAARDAAWDAARAAWAARAAAWAAARDAAWDAARAAWAAWAAARAAARDAAWDAARAAWDAARDAARAAARDAARAAARDAARDAAWDAARAARDACLEDILNHTLFVVLSGVYRESVLSA